MTLPSFTRWLKKAPSLKQGSAAGAKISVGIKAGSLPSPRSTRERIYEPLSSFGAALPNENKGQINVSQGMTSHQNVSQGMTSREESFDSSDSSPSTPSSPLDSNFPVSFCQFVGEVF